MKVLVVQRRLAHYRKLLLSRLGEMCGIQFDVFASDGKPETSRFVNLRVFPGRKRTFELTGRRVELIHSKDLVSEVAESYDDYDAIILEGATNLFVDLSIRKVLRGKKPYIVWDAGRRRGAEMTPLRKLAQAPLMKVWGDSAAIMAYSTLAKDYFVGQGIDQEKVFVCQNTLSVADFDKEIASIDMCLIDAIRKQFAPDGPLILYVGAVEPRKKLEDLVHAFVQVRETNPKANLLVIGGGDDLERVKSVAFDFGCKGIHFTGPIIDGVIAYFLACDLFVLPSEGGLALNQAMICSKPIIASSADGTELDLIDPGENGFLFDEGNVDQLSMRIRDAIAEPDRLVAMGKKSREIIDERANETLFAQNLIRCINYVNIKE